MNLEGREPYLSAAAQLIRESGCTVRRWRTGTTGRAYVCSDDWGIEAPQPRGPISFATFAHEVAHQMLHRDRRKARWLEELEAWEYALAVFSRLGVPGEERARADAAKSLVWTAAKAAKKCAPATAQAILDRYPEWVWTDGTDAVSSSFAYADVVQASLRTVDLELAG